MKISRFYENMKRTAKFKKNQFFLKFENQANFDENIKIAANCKKIQNLKKVK